MTIGVSSNYQWRSNYAAAAADLPRLKSLGITSIREDIFWSNVQPDSPTEWKWDLYDALFMRASKLGLQILPIIDYGTSWASAPKTPHDMPSTAIGQSAYGTFAAAVVSRYGPTGTFWREHAELRTPAKVMAVELWNEPWYAPSPSVNDYIALLMAAGAAIRRVAPNVTALANVDDRWINSSETTAHYWGQAVLEHVSELAPYIGGWAIHPYSAGQWSGNSPAADSAGQIGWLQQQLSQVHAKGNIWVTEIGFSTTPSPASSKGFSTYQTPTVAYPAFIRRASATTGANRVTHVWIFTPNRASSASHPGSWDYGYNLIDSDGNISPIVRDVVTNSCAPE